MTIMRHSIALRVDDMAQVLRKYLHLIVFLIREIFRFGSSSDI